MHLYNTHVILHLLIQIIHLSVFLLTYVFSIHTTPLRCMWWKLWKPVRSGLHGWRLAPRKCGAACTTSATSREGRVAYFGFDEVQVEVLNNSKFAQNLPRSPCQLPCDNMVLAHLQHFTWRITGENRREGEDDDEAYRHGKSLFDLKNCSGNNRFITHKNAYAVFEKTAMERSKERSKDTENSCSDSRKRKKAQESARNGESKSSNLSNFHIAGCTGWNGSCPPAGASPGTKLVRSGEIWWGDVFFTMIFSALRNWETRLESLITCSYTSYTQIYFNNM